MYFIAINDKTPVIETDSLEHFGQRENIRFFSVDEELNEEVFAKVTNVTEKAGVTITAGDIGTCHRLLFVRVGPKLCTFVRRETKRQLLRPKKTLKTFSSMSMMILILLAQGWQRRYGKNRMSLMSQS